MIHEDYISVCLCCQKNLSVAEETVVFTFSSLPACLDKPDICSACLSFINWDRRLHHSTLIWVLNKSLLALIKLWFLVSLSAISKDLWKLVWLNSITCTHRYLMDLTVSSDWYSKYYCSYVQCIKSNIHAKYCTQEHECKCI